MGILFAAQSCKFDLNDQSFFRSVVIAAPKVFLRACKKISSSPIEPKNPGKQIGQTEPRLTGINWIIYKARNVWDVF